MKSFNFDTLVEKIAKCEKAFGKKKTIQSNVEIACLAHKEKKKINDSSRGDSRRESNKRGHGRRQFRGRGGRHNQGERPHRHGTRCNINVHEARCCWITWEKISERQEQKQDKAKAPESAHYIVAHCNIGVNELFNTSFASWRDAWLLDTSATCHMIVQRGYFEDFSNHVDGIVYFADKSSLKPSRIGTVRLKLPKFLYFILHEVHYLPELQRSLLSLVHNPQQCHSIHIFDGTVEIMRASDNMVMTTGVEDGRLLKLKGTFACAHNFAC